MGIAVFIKIFDTMDGLSSSVYGLLDRVANVNFGEKRRTKYKNETRLEPHLRPQPQRQWSMRWSAVVIED